MLHVRHPLLAGPWFLEEPHWGWLHNRWSPKLVEVCGLPSVLHWVFPQLCASIWIWPLPNHQGVPEPNLEPPLHWWVPMSVAGPHLHRTSWWGNFANLLLAPLNLAFWAICERLGWERVHLWVLPVGGDGVIQHLHPVTIETTSEEAEGEIAGLGAIVQSKFSPCSWDQWWAICFKGLSSVSVSGGSDRCSWRCWATRSRRLFWSPYSNSRFRRSAKRSCRWGRVQSAELGIPPPSLRDLRGEGSGGCRRGWSQSTTWPLEVHLLEMIWAIAMAKGAGYSAVSELRKDPSSFLMPAKDGCRVGQVHQPAKDEIVASFEHRSQDLESCMPHWHAATWAQVAFQSLNISVLSVSNNVIAVGGVSHPTRAPLQCAAWSRTRPRRCTSSSSCSLCSWSADRSSLPSGCCGVLKAIGPLGLSFSLEYSRHGGAPQAPPTKPFQVVWRTRSKLKSSRMFQLSSISKGLILSTCKREHAWEIGLLRPAKRSRKNFPDVVKAKVPGGGEIGIGTVSSVPKSTGTWIGDLGAGVESQVLEPWLRAPCFWPHGLPPTLTAHRCANLHVLLLQVPRWYLWHSVFLLPSTTMKVHKSWLP